MAVCPSLRAFSRNTAVGRESSFVSSALCLKRCKGGRPRGLRTYGGGGGVSVSLRTSGHLGPQARLAVGMCCTSVECDELG